jgi:peptidyl-prolyl cis-trans isomerase D
MALINKIRERSGVAVAVIAISLILFIVGSDFLASNGQSGIFGGGTDNSVGNIAGNTVDAREFENQVQTQVQNYQAQSGRSVGEQEMQGIRQQVWQDFIFKYAYQQEFDALGLKVSEGELREMIQGTKNLHPYVRQQFANPQTGEVDRARLIDFINQAANNQLPIQQKQAWDQFKASLVQQRLREKYAALMTNSSYVTTAEAKKEYVAQNTRADLKYLYVPYYSINDTTVKVEDKDITAYFDAHKKEFQGFDSRSLAYVVYQVLPSKDDSTNLYSDLKTFAGGLATAPNAQKYASENSDTKVTYLKSYSELTEDMKSVVGTSIQGALMQKDGKQIFKEGNSYSLHKFEGTEIDSLYTVRASHILIRADSTMADSVRANALAKAQGILTQARSGTDFATLASQNGEDGTRQQGGDLGYFKNNGQMVKPFQDAIFAFSGTGVLPNVVKTDFGYHIIKVTEGKSNTRYKIASLTRTIEPSDATRTAILQKAENIRNSVKSLKDLEDAAKKDGKLVVLKADRINAEAASVNTLQNAREIVRWAFNDDTEVGDVSSTTFEVDNNMVVAVLTGASEKDSPKAEDFKDAITAKVRNEKKATQILAKLGNASGALEALAQKYGAGAVVENAANVNLATGTFTSAGPDPIAVGKGLGLAQGKRSKPFSTDTGVFIMENSKVTNAPEIADYSMYKTQIQQRSGGYNASALVNQAIVENAKIVDNRAKMY